MIGAAVLAYIPSPSSNGISIGSLRLHLYGLMIALGVVAAVWLAQRRWDRIGGTAGTMSMIAVWGVPGGLIGARLYSVITSWQQDTGGSFVRIFEIWKGGLGIWGGIAGGVAAGVYGARRAKLDIGTCLDCITPGLLLAQAIGRWGNYFNQELYGRPSTLPWALKIDPAHRPANYEAQATFQPTFLYESIWDLLCLGVLIWAERRFKIRRGYLFALYAALYTVGRFVTEYLRVDPAHKIGPLRLNDWVCILVFAGAVAVLATRGRWRPGLERAGDPLPADAPGRRPAAPLDTAPALADRAGEEAPQRGPT